MAKKTAETNLSNDTKTIIVVLLLLLFYPLGLIFMWFWVNWPKWVKWLISAPVALVILGFIAAILLAAVNPSAQIEKANCMNECLEKNQTSAYCTTYCSAEKITPKPVNSIPAVPKK